MTNWYVKDLSKLTKVSVQTLHHYDRINLLKPSNRMTNGYRVYSEQDLLKLQQIIALKFFGFELNQIKTFLASNTAPITHFAVQAQLLEEKAQSLLDASHTLKNLIATVDDNKSITWETIIQSIEVYRMTQQLEHAWVKDIFTKEELRQYAEFETALKANTTAKQKANFEKNWTDLAADLNNNIANDPNSALGINLADKCMTLINGLYGKKYAHLRTKKFEQGFGEGKGLAEVGLTKEAVAWLTIAMDAYWRKRIYQLLEQHGKISNTDLLNDWNELLDEMYGEESARKVAIVQLALQDDKVSAATKQWLRDLLPG